MYEKSNAELLCIAELASVNESIALYEIPLEPLKDRRRGILAELAAFEAAAAVIETKTELDETQTEVNET